MKVWSTLPYCLWYGYFYVCFVGVWKMPNRFHTANDDWKHKRKDLAEVNSCFLVQYPVYCLLVFVSLFLVSLFFHCFLFPIAGYSLFICCSCFRVLLRYSLTVPNSLFCAMFTVSWLVMCVLFPTSDLLLFVVSYFKYLVRYLFTVLILSRIMKQN